MAASIAYAQSDDDWSTDLEIRSLQNELALREMQVPESGVDIHIRFHDLMEVDHPLLRPVSRHDVLALYRYLGLAVDDSSRVSVVIEDTAASVRKDRITRHDSGTPGLPAASRFAVGTKAIISICGGGIMVTTTYEVKTKSDGTKYWQVQSVETTYNAPYCESSH